MVVDPSVLDATAAGLLAAARAPSAHTLASYERRWRMWEAFADHHGVVALPAEGRTCGCVQNRVGVAHARLHSRGMDARSRSRRVTPLAVLVLRHPRFVLRSHMSVIVGASRRIVVSRRIYGG